MIKYIDYINSILLVRHKNSILIYLKLRRYFRFAFFHEQYHGGTNFGRSAAEFMITSYYDLAPLDEYGKL